MRDAAWLPLIAAFIAAEFTLALIRRLVARHRPHLASWSVSLAFFTLGASALWYGTAFGWSDVSFRLYYLGGALLNVPWLALGQVQLLVKGEAARRWFLGVTAYSVFSAFIVAFSPLRARVSGFALPSGHDLYDPLPRLLVGVGNGLGALIIIGGVALTIWRGRSQQGAATRSRSLGVGLVAAGVLVAGAGGALSFVGRSSANALAITVGVTVIYWGFIQAGQRVGRHRT